MKAHKLTQLTVKEYIAQEIATNTKYEYHNGSIYALAGGTLNHGLICGNIYAGLRNKLSAKASNCLPFNSEVRLHIDKSNSYVYPDCMVICGDIERGKEETETVTNPIVIFEVLSKSTAEYDRGDKFFLYQKIPTFKEYVLIEQKKYVVDVHYKNNKSDLWQIIRYEGIDAVVKINSLGIEITMEELYYRTSIDLDE